MSSENADVTIESDPEPKVRRMRGPGKKEKTHDPKYYADYWNLKRSVNSHCENCGKLVVKGKMYKRIQTPICKTCSKTPEELQRIKDEYYAKSVGGD